MEKSENSTQLLFLRERHGNPLQYSCLENPMYRGAWQAAVHGISKTERLTLGFAVSLRRGRAALVPQTVKTLPAMKDFRVRFLDQEDPLEKELANHPSILTWRIPCTEEPGRLQSMQS